MGFGDFADKAQDLAGGQIDAGADKVKDALGADASAEQAPQQDQQGGRDNGPQGGNGPRGGDQN